jgi:6-pyruvoyltetrahydropterin/6-carboxytetrahydropterin synthase
MLTANRYHDISAGHRVAGHESKCAHLHGHNYRVHFFVSAPKLDAVGRVIDFSVIKTTLCQWLEDNWDHKMLIWEQDPILHDLTLIDFHGVVPVPFNPTAENMAEYLVNVVSLEVLPEGMKLVKCVIEETRKCSVTYELDNNIVV